MKQVQIILLIVILLVTSTACSGRDLGIPASSQVSKSDSQSEAKEASSQDSSEDSSQSEEVYSKKYADILTGGTYYIDCTAVIDMQGMTLENPMLIAVKEGNSSISISSDLSGSLVTMRTLVYDGNLYMVNDDQRSYSQIDPSQSANSFNTDYSELTYIGESEGDFCGETLSCSEYKQGDDTVRFFFKEKTLVGLTRSISDEQVSEMALKINGVSGNIPSHLIEMPIGYTKK